MRDIVLAVALVLVSSAAATAHMKVAKTSPAEGESLAKAPAHVQVWFTQKPDAAMSKLSLTGPKGDVSLFVHPAEENSLMGMIQEKSLADGTYVVKWQAAGDDGHIQRGEFTFTLKPSE